MLTKHIRNHYDWEYKEIHVKVSPLNNSPDDELRVYFKEKIDEQIDKLKPEGWYLQEIRVGRNLWPYVDLFPSYPDPDDPSDFVRVVKRSNVSFWCFHLIMFKD